MPLDDDGGSRSATTPLSHAKARAADPLAAMASAFKTPIKLHGRVEDQHGDPIPDAVVRLSPGDAPWESSKSETVIRTDAQGKFSADNLLGAYIGVSVAKEGYLYISPVVSPASSTVVYYAAGAEDGKRHSNPETPLVLALLKPGPMEPLIHVRKKRWKIPFDGTPQFIALDDESGNGLHKIEFRFWSDTHSRREPGKSISSSFDWSFEMRIAGGGFVWDHSDLNFEAPASGYNDAIRYDFPATMPRDQWKRERSGRYFVKFADGSYGRIQFQIDGFSDRRPLYMESWLNLKPGSRNFAVPNMSIKVTDSKEPED
jgi:hypothetical protein